MLKTWLKHKILEYCIDLVFREFYKNFIFPTIVPKMVISFEEHGIIIQDDQNMMVKRFGGKLNSMDYANEVSKLAVEFMRKHHPKTFAAILDTKIDTSDIYATTITKARSL